MNRRGASIRVEEIWQILVPLLIFAGFLLCGYALRIFLSIYLPRLKKSKTKVGDIVLSAVKTPVILIFLVIGANFALAHAPLTQETIEQYFLPISYVLVTLIASIAFARIITGLLRNYGTAHPTSKGLVSILSKTITGAYGEGAECYVVVYKERPNHTFE